MEFLAKILNGGIGLTRNPKKGEGGGGGRKIANGIGDPKKGGGGWGTLEEREGYF